MPAFPETCAVTEPNLSGAPQRAAVAERLRAVACVRQDLHGAASVDDLFARASASVARRCGFDRGLVVGVEAGMLTATATGAVPDEAGDRLRRTLLAGPVPLERATLEHEIVRRGSGIARGRDGWPSLLAEVLGLAHHVYAAIAPEGQTLALLVVDRAAHDTGEDDVAAVECAAAFVALELSLIVQRARVQDLAAEVRGFAATSLALARETTDAPVALPRDLGLGPAFPAMDATAMPAGMRARALFSDRELRVAGLLAEGRSNREIAEVLTISPETVKTHVARILRKLGATNRAEAVSLFLRLPEDAS